MPLCCGVFLFEDNMADPRILTFKIPLESTSTKFQIQFSSDETNWTLLKVGGVTELDDSLVTSRTYVLDGVNTTDGANENGAVASTPPMFYRHRIKGASTWGEWSTSYVFPSSADFVQNAKQQLKDPSLSGGNALLSNADYRLHLANAVEMFERGFPREATNTVTMGAADESYALPYDWANGLSRVTQVEYPTGETPRQFVAPDRIILDEELGEFRLRDLSTSTSETMRLYYETKHARDGSTIPSAFFNSVLLWMMGDCAEQLKAYKNQFGDVIVGADYMAIDPRIKAWGEIAKSYKQQAEKVWESGTCGVRTHIVSYDDHGRIAPSVLVF